MNITIQVNPPMLNTTLYLTNQTHCVIIDPAHPETCKTYLEENNLTPVAVLLTHSHFDHIAGLEALLPLHPKLPIYIHAAELDALFSAEKNLSTFVGMDFQLPPNANTLPLQNKQKLEIPSPSGSFSFLVYHMPGHSSGSCIYEFTATNNETNTNTYLATGDFLFEGTIGITDLADGASETMKQSLRTFKDLFQSRLQEHIQLIPGHAASPENYSTTLEKEWKTNPYLSRI